MTSVSSMINSFSAAYQFDHKSNIHLNAADKYDQILTEIDFEKSYPTDPDFFTNLGN